MDDLCDSSVDIQIIGTLLNRHTLEKHVLVDVFHLHIKSSDPVPVLCNLPENACVMQKEPRFLIDSSMEILASQKINSLRDASDVTTAAYEFKSLTQERIDSLGTFCFDRDWDNNENKCKYKRKNGCGFCLFMKGGPCRSVFIDWEKCVDSSKTEDGEDAFIEKCYQQTLALKTCVDKHPEYYYTEDKKEQEDTAGEQKKDVRSVT